MEKAKEIKLIALREYIIETIKSEQTTSILLGSLIFEDARKCLQDNRWDGVWYNLDLTNKKIMAEVSTYPNAVGASYSDKFSISPEKYNAVALEYSFDDRFLCLDDEDALEFLFDEKLRRAIAEVEKIKKEEAEEQQRKEREKYAIKLPLSFKNIKPKMNFKVVNIVLSQRYAKSQVMVTRKDNSYFLEYQNESYLSSKYSFYLSTTLTPAQCIWLEENVNATLNNKDQSTWTSIVGGDLMDVNIKEDNRTFTYFRRETPVNKYNELKHLLEKATQYGFIFEGK